MIYIYYMGAFTMYMIYFWAKLIFHRRKILIKYLWSLILNSFQKVRIRKYWSVHLYCWNLIILFFHLFIFMCLFVAIGSNLSIVYFPFVTVFHYQATSNCLSFYYMFKQKNKLSCREIAPDRARTRDILIRRPVPNPLSHGGLYYSEN